MKKTGNDKAAVTFLELTEALHAFTVEILSSDPPADTLEEQFNGLVEIVERVIASGDPTGETEFQFGNKRLRMRIHFEVETLPSS